MIIVDGSVGRYIVMFDKFFRRFFPSVYRTHEKRLSEISKIGYVTLEDYKQDIIDINNELKEIDLTIEYFKDRRIVLTDWKRSIEVKMDKWNELDICSNCKYCNNLYCSKFNFQVVGEATCDEFDWR